MKTFRIFGLMSGLAFAALSGCSAPATCDATTCSTGCCDADGQCRPGGEVDACGVGGRACVSCAGAQTCDVGVCSSTGTGGGTGGGGGTTGGGTGTDYVVTINEVATSDGDFFELINTGTTTADLSGFQVADLDVGTDGPKFSDALTLPAGTTLAPGAILLFSEGSTAGPSTSCGSAQVTSCFRVTFGLSAGNGDALFLVNASGVEVLRRDVPPDAHPPAASWGRLPDGTGAFQVTSRTPGLPNVAFMPVDAGTTDAGSPDAGPIEVDGGMTLPDGGAPPVVFNEVAVSNGDFFELYNASGAPVDLSGFKVADLDNATGGPKVAEAVTLPAGTVLAPGGFLLFYEGSTCGGAASCLNIPFGLSSSGEALFLLTSADAVELRFDVPASPHGANRSLGRIPDGTGTFVENARTPGAPNQLVSTGDAGVPDAGAPDVAFNEVAVSNGDFFELINLGASVDLSGFKVADLDGATDGPKLSDAVTLPAGTVLASGARLLFYEGSTCGTASSCINFPFGLSGSGEAVFLLSPGDAVLLRLDVPAGAHAANRSWGRIPDGTGAFVETARTPGGENALFVEVDAGTPDAGAPGDAGVDEVFVVVRVGPGQAADGGLTNASTPVTLEWRAVSTGAVQRALALPTAASGAHRPFAVSGSATSEGLLSRAQGGWVLGGYGVAPGLAGVVSASGVERVVAWAGDDGGTDTTTAFTDAYAGNNLRAAASVDGTGFWTGGTSGTNGGVRYAGVGAPATVDVFSGVTNVRAVKIFGGQLYASTAANTTAVGTRVFSVGAGLPQATTATTGELPGLTLTAPTDFALLDLQAPVGPDRLYVVDSDSGTVRGFDFDGTTWAATSTLTPAAGTCLTVAARASSTGVTVLCSTGANVYRWSDDGTPAQLVVGAPAGFVFRGVGFE